MAKESRHPAYSVPVDQSTLRPRLLVGAEREAAIVNGAFALLLPVIVGVGWQSVVVALGVLVVGHLLLQLLASYDPIFVKVFLGSLKFPRFMSALPLEGENEKK